MTTKRIIVGFVAVIVAVAALSYFYFGNGDSGSLNPPPSGRRDTIPGIVRIGYPALRIALPVLIAKEQGYFERHGLNVELVRYETAQPMMDALVGGSLEVAGYCALPITFSAMVRSKTPLVFISSLMEDDQHPISILLVKRGSSLTSIGRLAGKRIGILPTRAYELWLREVLAKNGVDPSGVVIQQIPPPQQGPALSSGSVDALFTNDPASTAIQELGIGVNLTPGKAIVPATTGQYPFYFGSFNVTKTFAERYPATVRGLSLALDEAIDFLNSQPDAAVRLMERFLPPEQQKLVAKFPPSLFKKTNETTQAALDAVMAYYLRAQILTGGLDLRNAQFSRRE
jgi:ABC-type nitrate/sulfonate/bicarbonate transport system substrate-binding protein